MSAFGIVVAFQNSQFAESGPGINSLLVLSSVVWPPSRALTCLVAANRARTENWIDQRSNPRAGHGAALIGSPAHPGPPVICPFRHATPGAGCVPAPEGPSQMGIE